MNSNYKVIKFRSNNSKEVNDQISIEEPLEIILKYKEKKKLDRKYYIYYDENTWG